MSRRVWPALVALLIALAIPRGASAHTFLVRSDPPDGAAVGVNTRRIQLWLSHASVADPSEQVVIGADGRRYPLAAAITRPYQPRDVGLADQFDPTYLFFCSLGLSGLPSLLTLDLPALAPGTYQLAWRAIAVDDRTATPGTLVFVVQPAPTADSPAPAAAPAAAPMSQTVQADDLVVSLGVRPNLPGANFLSLGVFNSRRPAPAPIGSVEVRLIGPAGPLPAVVAERVGDGRYQINSDVISTPGSWRAAVTVHRAQLPDAAASVAWDVPAPAALLPDLPRVPALHLAVGAATLLALAVAIRCGALPLSRRSGRGGRG
jgi:methionine-rich copper-binding protein CopC